MRAVLFDDESIILQGLAENVDWTSYGVELAGTAGNGIQALELFRREKPDLVMTDIRMPGLNGLQVIEAIMQEAPETLCIVFSGFNEFDYIKTAMKLEVVDYLEKPVTIEKIEEALERSMKKVAIQQEYAGLRAEADEHREALLTKSVLDLLLVGPDAEAAWRHRMGSEADSIVGVTVLSFSDVPPLFPDFGTCRQIVVKPGDDWAVVLFHYIRPEVSYWDELMAATADMSETFGSGLTYTDVAETRRSYIESRRALRYGRFLEERGWVRIEDVGDALKESTDISDVEESLLFDLRTFNRVGMYSQMDALRERILKERLSPDVVEQEVLRLAYIGTEAIKAMGKNVKFSHPSLIHFRELNHMRTRDEMVDWLRRLLDEVMDDGREARQPSVHQGIEKAKLYIQEHYHLDISLQEVAGHTGMNATYFSLLFKEKTGVSYISYVTRIRIDHAKTLLRSGMRVNEVHEKVGYYKYRHFTELFKKYVGCTPGQYREQAETLGAGGRILE